MAELGWLRLNVEEYAWVYDDGRRRTTLGNIIRMETVAPPNADCCSDRVQDPLAPILLDYAESRDCYFNGGSWSSVTCLRQASWQTTHGMETSFIVDCGGGMGGLVSAVLE